MSTEPQEQVGPTEAGGKGMALALGVLAVGLVLVAVGAVVMFQWSVGSARWMEAVATVSLVMGGVLAGTGATAILFRALTHRSIEWFLAWRYLATQESATKRTISLGLTLAGVTLVTLVGAAIWDNSGPQGFLPMYRGAIRYIQAVGLGLGLFSYLMIFFGALLIYFSLFTTISIFGVFLGTSSLVVVLSVMGGFEADLKRKILGTTAHVTVTRQKQTFTDYKRVMAMVRALPEVTAVTPYLESEVMITSQTNLSGVLLRGIDPETVGQVTDLPRYLEAKEGAGSLEYLKDPKKLARLPSAQVRPFVSDPMGEPPDFADDEPALERKGQGKGKGKGSGAGIIRRLAGDGGEEIKEPKEPVRPVYRGIIIGAELAKNLRLYVGDDVNLVAPLGGMSPMGPIPRSKPYRVAGIFYSGMYEYDTKIAYVTIPSAQRFLGLGQEISGVEIKVKEMERATELAELVQARLKGKGYKVRDWKQLNSNLFSALKLERVVMFIVLTFIVLVASFSIITTLIMVVLEKRREIAALKAMGATDPSVLKIFLYAGLYIGAIGMMVGLFTGLSICLFLAFVGLPLDPEVYYISELPVRLSAPDIMVVALAAVLLSFLATIYPSMLAARMKPVDGLRRYIG